MCRINWKSGVAVQCVRLFNPRKLTCVEQVSFWLLNFVVGFCPFYPNLFNWDVRLINLPSDFHFVYSIVICLFIRCFSCYSKLILWRKKIGIFKFNIYISTVWVCVCVFFYCWYCYFHHHIIITLLLLSLLISSFIVTIIAIDLINHKCSSGYSKSYRHCHQNTM